MITANGQSVIYEDTDPTIVQAYYFETNDVFRVDLIPIIGRRPWRVWAYSRLECWWGAPSDVAL